jgi:hypothetical protein
MVPMGEAIKTFRQFSAEAELALIQQHQMRRTLSEIRETIKASESALRWWRPPPSGGYAVPPTEPFSGSTSNAA